MDNLTQRRIIAGVGLIIVLVGLSALIWGIFRQDYAATLIGVLLLVIGYVLSVIMNKLVEKARAHKKGVPEKDSKIE